MWSSESKSRNGRCSRALPTLGGPVQLQAPGKCASGLACSIRRLGDPLFTVWGEKDVFPGVLVALSLLEDGIAHGKVPEVFSL